MSSAGRNLLIDALKFFAIALVPLQHLLNLRPEFSSLPGAHAAVVFMVSFDMPLFVFLSGFVLFGREGSSAPLLFLKRKAMALLVPYFAWVTVEMARERLALTQWAAKVGAAAVQPHQAYQMWFLWVLFVLFVIFTAVRLVSRSDMALVVLAVGAELARLLPRTTTAGVDKILLLTPFFVLGYLCARHREKLRAYDGWITWLGVPLFAALSFVPMQSLNAAHPATVLLQFPLAVSGIVTFWALYRLMPDHVLAPQAWVGRKSLGIYAGQMVCLPYAIVGTDWLGVALSQVTTMLTSTALAVALELTPFTRAVFLGQWPKPARLAAPVAQPAAEPVVPESALAARPTADA